MNNKIIAIIVIAIVVLGGGYFLMKNKSAHSPSNSNEQTAVKSSAETTSMQALIASGASRQCTYSSVKADGSTTGTIYVSGGKMRGDVSATVKQGTTVTHILNNGTTTYMWSDDNKFAFKMAFNPNDANAVSATSNARAVDLKQDFDFSCQDWTADSSKFDLPSGVTFKDLPGVPVAPKVQAGASAETGIDSKAAAQLACNYMSGSAKDECLKATK